MKAFKTKEFARFARREGIADLTLWEAADRALRGLVDADLGGGLIKQRVARRGQGRRGGYRTLMAFRADQRTVFLYGFAKSERDNTRRTNWISGGGWRRRSWRWTRAKRLRWRRLARSSRCLAMGKVGYRNARLGVLHKTARALSEVGALDKATMRDLDAFCLTPVESVSGEEIRSLRAHEGVSQAVLARHLNVGTKLVSDWERGVKRPSGPSLKLLTLACAKGLDAIA